MGLTLRRGVACYRELPRIPIPRTPVNKPWVLLQASPLHGVNYLLRPGEVDADAYRFTLHVQDDSPTLLPPVDARNKPIRVPEALYRILG
jgi:hypothetical protein